MEDLNVLDVKDENHIFSLHYIYFLHRTNANLHRFKEHPLSSEGNITPSQLWTIGLTRSNQDPYFVEINIYLII